MRFGKKTHLGEIALCFTELVNVYSSMYQIRISSKDKGVGQEA